MITKFEVLERANLTETTAEVIDLVLDMSEESVTHVLKDITKWVELGSPEVTDYVKNQDIHDWVNRGVKAGYKVGLIRGAAVGLTSATVTYLLFTKVISPAIEKRKARKAGIELEETVVVEAEIVEMEEK